MSEMSTLTSTKVERRVAVITGAASGIGRGLAEHAAGLGLRLVLADFDKSNLMRLAAKLRLDGAEVLAKVTDVSDHAQVKQLRQATLERFGGVDLLFNNAGVMQTGYSWEIDPQQWQRILDVNLRGVINGVNCFVPLLLEQKRPAHVINTASLAGLICSPLLAAYTVTKQAVVALSETLHYDLAQLHALVSVSVICPGPVSSEIMKSDAGQRDSPSSFNVALDRHINSGMSPRELAVEVFKAIDEKQFWILPHKEFKPALERRLLSILDETNPEFISDGLQDHQQSS